jgi:hypothetical protein
MDVLAAVLRGIFDSDLLVAPFRVDQRDEVQRSIGVQGLSSFYLHAVVHEIDAAEPFPVDIAVARHALAHAPGRWVGAYDSQLLEHTEPTRYGLGPSWDSTGKLAQRGRGASFAFSSTEQPGSEFFLRSQRYWDPAESPNHAMHLRVVADVDGERQAVFRGVLAAEDLHGEVNACYRGIFAPVRNQVIKHLLLLGRERGCAGSTSYG